MTTGCTNVIREIGPRELLGGAHPSASGGRSGLSEVCVAHPHTHVQLHHAVALTRVHVPHVVSVGAEFKMPRPDTCRGVTRMTHTGTHGLRGLLSPWPRRAGRVDGALSPQQLEQEDARQAVVKGPAWGSPGAWTLPYPALVPAGPLDRGDVCPEHIEMDSQRMPATQAVSVRRKVGGSHRASCLRKRVVVRADRRRSPSGRLAYVTAGGVGSCR